MVSDILIMASVYNADRLKHRAINFININIPNIVETVGWKKLSKEHPYLVVEIFNAPGKSQIPPIEPLCKKIKQ